MNRNFALDQEVRSLVRNLDALITEVREALRIFQISSINVSSGE